MPYVGLLLPLFPHPSGEACQLWADARRRPVAVHQPPGGATPPSPPPCRSSECDEWGVYTGGLTVGMTDVGMTGVGLIEVGMTDVWME